jgi:sugar phosphate isomerase/epimerase
MSLKLGMPTLIEMPDIDETIELCKQLRLDFIELNMNMPEFCPESLPAGYLREMARKAGISFTVHMPDDTDLASFHDPIREGHMKRFGETALWAAEAGAKLINLHLSPGIYFTLPDRRVWIYERYYDKFLRNLLEAYGKVLAYASDFGLTVCTENVSNFQLPFVARAIDDLCAAFPQFRLTWDLGHDAKTRFQETPVLLRHRDRVAHLHLHDYNGRSDHQVPFTGQIDIMAALRFAAERKATVLIETKTREALARSANLVEQRLPEIG